MRRSEAQAVARRTLATASESLKCANTRSWRKALKRAGITNFRWHDLRHTWASWLVQRRVPLFVLQELGGWQSAEMVRSYAHLSPSVNARYAAEIDLELSRHSSRSCNEL